MEPQDRTYKAADGTELPVRVWPAVRYGPTRAGAVAPPRAAIVYLHGIQSHSGWYEASSRCLAAAGIAVYQIERRGSGRDVAHERGHVDRAETWIDDVTAAAKLARRETGLEGVHLLGVSWGGKLALAAAADRSHLYRSLILAAPGILPRIDAALTTKMRVAACLLAGRPRTRFPVPLDDPALFTANPDRRQFIADDPLALREVTARFLYESRRLDRLARRAARSMRLPVFLALAETDLIIDNPATRRLVESMPSRDRRVVTYPESHHTLEFDPDPSRYFADLEDWIRHVEGEP